MTRAMDEEGAWLGAVIAASDMGLRSEAAAKLSHRLAKMHEQIAALKKERDAALADNAVLLQALKDVAELRLSGPTLQTMAVKLRSESHPGAALLEQHQQEIARWAENVETVCAERDAERRLRMEQAEQHQKALVRARNDGLERAAQVADDAAEGAGRRADAASADPNPDAANWDNGAANEARNIASTIRAMKAPVSDDSGKATG